MGILNRFLVWIGFNRRNGWLKNLFTYDFDTHVLVQASVNELDLSFVPLQSGLILVPAIIGLDKFYRINCSLPVSTVKQIQFNLWSVIEEKRQLCRRSPPPLLFSISDWPVAVKESWVSFSAAGHLSPLALTHCFRPHSLFHSLLNRFPFHRQ